MEAVFLKMLNMSITAGWITLAILVLRLVLKKAPREIVCGLWVLVGVRLIFPFSIESALSLIPSVETVPEEIVYAKEPAIESGIGVVNSILNPVISSSFAPNAGDSVNPLQVITAVAAVLWIVGMVAMTAYAGVSFLRLRRKVYAAMRIQHNIWICDDVKSPFILGVFRPRIYLPSDLEQSQMEYVIAHEKAHLSRRDHFWKPLGFLLLTVYWFNPLIWVAYILLCRDIELACDERVVREMGDESRKNYAEMLLFYSTPKSMISVCPLAFGEVGVKQRIKTVLNYKKPGFWVGAIAVVACFVAAVCFLTNPITAKNSDTDGQNQAVQGQASLAQGEQKQAEQEKKPSLQALDKAISAAILEENASEHSVNYFCCESHVILHTQAYEEAPMSEESQSTPMSEELQPTQMVTAYIMALYQEYAVDEKGIREESGTHGPLALTFEIGEDGNYALKEFWRPGDGSYYVADIKEKFPEAIVKYALDTQKYIMASKQACYAQAVENAGEKMDVNHVIEQLFEAIESSPLESSNPMDYIEAHSIEYRELLYYGEYTYLYAMRWFAEGFTQEEKMSLRTRLALELIQDLTDQIYQTYTVTDGVRIVTN